MKRIAAAPLPACPDTVRLLPSPNGTATDRATPFSLPAPIAAEPASSGRASGRRKFPAAFLAQLSLQGDSVTEARAQRRERARLAAKAYAAPRPPAKAAPRIDLSV